MEWRVEAGGAHDAAGHHKRRVVSVPAKAVDRGEAGARHVHPTHDDDGYQVGGHPSNRVGAGCIGRGGAAVRVEAVGNILD